MRDMNVDTLPKADRVLYLALSRGPCEEIVHYTAAEAYEINRFRMDCNPDLWGCDDDPPVRREYRSGWYRDESGPYCPALLEYLAMNRIEAIRFAARIWGFEANDPDTLRAAGLEE